MTRLQQAIVSSGCVLAMGVAGCDKAQLLAPTSSTIAVSASARILPIGGSTEISAMVIEQAGTAVQNGTTVRFTATLGRVEPVEAQTRNGLATTMFFAGESSGVSEVRATSGAVGAGSTGTGSGTTTATNVVQITIGAAAVTAVVISAVPSAVSSAGGTVVLVAAAVDGSGNRLVGVPVTFSTTAGTLSAGVATTGANGEARVELITSRAATVTARAGNQTASASITVVIPAGLALSVSPTAPVAGSPLTLTVTPTIPSGSPPPRVVVTWGDDSEDDLGAVASARGVVHTYSKAGSYTITARGTSEGETATTSTAVTIGPAPVPVP